MSDQLSDQQHDRIEQLLTETIGAPRLSPAQRQRHLERLHAAMLRQERQRRRISRRSIAELGLVSTVALILVIVAVVVTTRQDEAADDGQGGAEVADVVAAAQPLAPGEARHVRFRIQADIRRDQGLTLMWSIDRWERVTEDGTQQEHVEVHDAAGHQIASYTHTGDSWAWTQNGWTETGSLGVANLPEPIRAASVEPHTAAEYLTQPRESDVIEIVRDERGEIARYRFGSLEALSWTRSEFGIEATAAVYELVHDPTSGELVETRVYLVTAEGEEITLGRYEFLEIETMRADELDNTMFSLPADALQALQYVAPEAGALPLGLVIRDHRREFLGGSETLSLASTELEFELRVGPSTGGFDPRAFEATRSPDTEVHSTDSVVGPIVWVEQDTSDIPSTAFWDDGRYRYTLRLVTQDAPNQAWNAAMLTQLAEALSVQQRE